MSTQFSTKPNFKMTVWSNISSYLTSANYWEHLSKLIITNGKLHFSKCLNDCIDVVHLIVFFCGVIVLQPDKTYYRCKHLPAQGWIIIYKIKVGDSLGVKWYLRFICFSRCVYNWFNWKFGSRLTINYRDIIATYFANFYSNVLRYVNCFDHVLE